MQSTQMSEKGDAFQAFQDQWDDEDWDEYNSEANHSVTYTEAMSKAQQIRDDYVRKQATKVQDEMKETTVVRIRRKGGIIVQNCDIYIGRALTMGGWNLEESKWHNPFKLTDYNNDVNLVLEKYETYLRSNKELMDKIFELKGKILGCFCKPKPCHGDILIKILGEEIKKREH